MDNLNQQATSSQPLSSVRPNQTIPLPPNSPTPSKPFIILLLVMLIIIVGVGAYTLGINHGKTIVQNQQATVSPTVTQPSPTPDGTANWITHNSEKLKYSIKYPPDWSLRETPRGDFFGSTLLLPPGETNNPNAGSKGIAIDFRDITYAPPPPESQVDQKTEPVTFPPVAETGYKKIESALLESRYHKIRSVYIKDAGFEIDVLEPNYLPEATHNYHAKIRYDKYEYIFYFGKQLDRKYDSVFDQILSTFKFTNVSWEEAVELIRSCQVKMVSQTHSRNVDITLKDGTIRITVEPKLDMVTEEAESASTKCGFDISVETE